MDRRVRESPVLRALEQLCTKEIPLFDGCKSVERVGEAAASPYMSYSYECNNADNLKVKEFYKDSLSKRGWDLMGDFPLGAAWTMEFRRPKQEVSLMHLGDRDIYTLTCKNVPN